MGEERNVAGDAVRISARSSRPGNDRSYLRGMLRRPAASALALLAFAYASPSASQLAELTVPGGSGAEVAENTVDPLHASAVEARIREAEAERAEVAQRASNAASSAERDHLEQVGTELRELAEALEEQQFFLQRETTRDAAAPSNEPPSIFALNSLLDLRFERDQARDRLEEVLAHKRALLEGAKERQKKADQDRREARSEIEADREGAGISATRKLELRTLEARVAQARTHLRTLEVRAATRERDEALSQAGLDGTISDMRDALARGEGKAGPGFASLAGRITALRQERDRAEQKLATTRLRLEVAQKHYAEQRDPTASSLAEVEALATQHASNRLRIDALDSRIENLTDERKLFEEWQGVLRGELSRDELFELQQTAAERDAHYEQTLLQAPGRIADLRRRIQAADERLAGTTGESAARRALEGDRKELSALLEARVTEASDAEASRRANQRLQMAIRGKRGEFDPVEWTRLALGSVGDAWRYEITAVEDSPITVGSVVIALILFGVGTWAARRGSAFVGHLAAERFKLDAGAAHALQTLAFYAFLVSFSLLALRAVHFPLTAFTVLGGALAIGIGFGSQNVMNNFISGLILMLERPVRARDVIEVDGNHGTVERIGARSTQIRSMDGRHIIVPNSFFLENNVVNWTLSDDLLRTVVSVGVAYGSPTRQVADLIQQAVDEEVGVIKEPAPIIIFNEFGDNSLNFDTHFWVRARSPMATRVVQSRLRFRIDELFRENGLVIAFPQRDVHLDTLTPLEVRVVKNDRDPDPS